MKKITYGIIMLVICFFMANSGITQDIPSFGPAPVSDTKYEQGVNNTLLGVNTRGFVYISGTSLHQFGKQFMGNTTVTNIGSPFTAAGWIGATTRNTTTKVIYVNNQASPFQIWSVDTTTGATTLVVSSCTGLPQTNFTGMAWDHTTNTMYGVSSSLSASSIFTINMTTGVCTPVGSPSTTITGAIGLYCAPNGTLFSNCIVTDNLYKWNKTTGAATLVGPLGYNANYGQDGGFDLSDGKLYLASAGPGNILRICDTTTGSATTVVGTYTGQPACLAVCGNMSTPVTRVWTEQTSPVTTALYSVSAVSNDVAWACGAGGKVIRTTNKGITWTNVSGTLPTAYSFYAIFAWDANIALATASPAAGDYVYRTSDGGATWTQVYNLAGGFGNGLWMTDANTAYHVGDPVGGNWMLQKSTNGGVNWFTWATVASTAAGWNNAFMVVGNNVWMGTNANYLMYSSNLGVNWSQQTTTFTNQYSVWFNNATNGLCAYNALNKTTNSGVNWTALTSPLAASCGGICGTGSEWYVAPQSTAVYVSTNDGTSWATGYTAPDGAFYHLTHSRTGNTVWGVRSNGKISRYGDPPTGITPITVTVPENYSLSQNYPNPFNPTTKINFSITKSGLTTLKVYDLLGKEVATLINQNLNAGTYVADFDGANLSSGVYFYKLEVNGFTEVKRMTLLK